MAAPVSKATQPAPGSVFAGLSLDIEDITTKEVGGLQSELIIQSSEQIRCSVRFRLGGILALPLNNLLASAAGNDYQVTYTAESQGPGNEIVLATRSFSAVAGQLVYEADTQANVPAATLQPGTYRMVATVRMTAFPFVTGYAEGFIIQIV